MSAVDSIPNPPDVFSRPATPLTRADLDRMPDDGYRHELIDGVLLVTPSPSFNHQDVALNLIFHLRQVCPPELYVMGAPFDMVLADDTVMIPDVLVARRDAFTKRDLPGPPLLAVEVLSPSTRRFDVMVKFSRLEAAGCAAYWVVDPDTPSLIAWELQDGAYVQVAKVTGEESARLTSPYDVTVVPADLIS
ncbi:Uma2 family endonuclease [Kribbella sindirgiensis]|uniref:Uma2 family endonuclease n=1 Tax=Kribbella sindirgiensis TaxID=1124744 RepID=A0A4R0IA49_9ACTN|nr:Uma2 family endonuclease [Kribbella sindirgiensis]TCC28630.1 Uma2 family endonuclease [Kribbella sindirgiensis]